MNIKTLIFSILLLATFLGTSILAIFSAKKMTTNATHTSSANSIDFFLTNAVYTKFNREGMIRNRVNTNKITHFVTDNASLFEKPNITIYNPNEQPYYITANQGKSEKGKEKIYLWDNVKIIQNNNLNNPTLDITTSAITFYPSTKIAETKEPIVIIQNGDLTEAIGAEADFQNDLIKLLSKVNHTKFDRQKNIQYKVYADTITDFIKDKIYLFEKPQIILYNSNNTPCYLSANHGKSKQNNTTVHLKENVRVVQAAGPNNPDLDVTTTSLTFYPEMKFAETNEAITIVQKGNTTKAVGAKINLKTGEVKFLSKFQGVFKI